MGLQVIQNSEGIATGVYIPINEWNTLKKQYKILRNLESTLDSKPGASNIQSPALQGSPLSNQEFVNWVKAAEETPAISLHEAKTKWANKRKQLQRLSK
jgi:hypothetical protein